MPTVAKKNDIVRIPVYTAACEENTLTVEWSKYLATVTETYYQVIGKNVTQKGAETKLFIQKDWYNDKNTGAAEHISKIAQKKDEEYYEIKIDDKFKYGQDDSQGNNFFIVYHKKSHALYQHRFGTMTAARKVGETLHSVTSNMKDLKEGADTAKEIIMNAVGHPLRDF